MRPAGTSHITTNAAQRGVPNGTLSASVTTIRPNARVDSVVSKTHDPIRLSRDHFS